MEILKSFRHIEDYGQSGHFPVYGENVEAIQ